MQIELNNREAFGDIVRRYQNLVSAVTYSITGNVQESEDLAQETFIAAWQRLHELREVEKLPAWLCGIARNLANNWIRRTQRERHSRCDSAGMCGMTKRKICTQNLRTHWQNDGL